MFFLPKKDIVGVFMYSQRKRKQKKIFQTIPQIIFETFFML